ncbi:hypothetical protein QBC39DRAFT_168328 [Podospora conica]|nr:hypothetical protein QBC39DRAFT_168328 [Schizothecium conicum]
MQRVSAFLPSWDRSKSASTTKPATAGGAGAQAPSAKPTSPTPLGRRTSRPLALDKVFGWAEKISAAPGSRISLTTNVPNAPTRVAANHAVPTAEGRYHRENYWPLTLDKEADKAARILKSFCIDGFLVEEPSESKTSGDGATIRAGTPTEKDAEIGPRSSNEIGATTEIEGTATDAGSKTENGVEPTATAETDAEPIVEMKRYTTMKIPPGIVQSAQALAIFSCVRSGVWMSGSGGAGLITARMSDGTWSPPSGIILHTAALGFVLGVDIYDCVLVINDPATYELFTRPKLTLGTDCKLTVGPLVDMDVMDRTTRPWKSLDKTVLTYVRARGKHQPVQLDGSSIQERGNENERFYGVQGVSVLDILANNIPKNIPEMKPLFAMIQAAEGRTDYDKALVKELAQQPAPGDAVIETPKTSPASASAAPRTPFGIPDADDPDPFGVLSLEMAGIEIREAGSRLRPTSNQFEFNPSPGSPLYSRFNRQSIDTYLSRSNRGSYMSSKTQATAVTDACTQTDVASTADTSFSRANSDDGRDFVGEKLPTVMEPDETEIDYTQIDMSAIARFRQPAPAHDETVGSTPMPAVVAAPTTATLAVATEPAARSQVEDDGDCLQRIASSETEAPKAESVQYESSVYPADERDEDADDEDDEEEEEEDVVICEVATAQPTRRSIRASQIAQVVVAKGAIVTIPKRIPPPLPARSPARNSRASKSDFGGEVSGLKSPLRNSFLSAADHDHDHHETDVGTPDSTSSEVFATPLAFGETLDLTTATTSTSELEKPEVQGHRKNTSSVCTAVVAPVETATTDVPPVPQALDQQSPSTPEESDGEPRTPATADAVFSASMSAVKKEGTEKVVIATAHPETTSGIAA